MSPPHSSTKGVYLRVCIPCYVDAIILEMDGKYSLVSLAV